jgi:hypothetical protein
MMMNSEFVAQASADLAARILGDPQVDDARRIQTLYAWAYGREATADEMTQAGTFVTEVEKALQSEQPDSSQRRRQAWDSLCQVVLAANEFIYLK